MLFISATRGGGLASLDPKPGVFTRYTWFEEWPGTPGMRGCSAIHEDQHGMLWLATKSDGVVDLTVHAACSPDIATILVIRQV